MDWRMPLYTIALLEKGDVILFGTYVEEAGAVKMDWRRPFYTVALLQKDDAILFGTHVEEAGAVKVGVGVEDWKEDLLQN
eukprot:393602-Pelagomonas_calceolata.AAC.3